MASTLQPTAMSKQEPLWIQSPVREFGDLKMKRLTACFNSRFLKIQLKKINNLKTPRYYKKHPQWSFDPLVVATWHQ